MTKLNATSCNPRLFADNNFIIVRNSTLSGLEHECNRKLQKLHKWCLANELQINPKKSEALMIFTQLFAPVFPLTLWLIGE